MKRINAAFAGCLSLVLQAQVLPAPRPAQRLSPSVQAGVSPNNLTDAQKKAILQRLLFTKEPFLQSYEARMMPDTMGSFFHVAEYQTLAGNPGVGYYHADTGFSWTTPAVAFVPFEPTTQKAKGIHSEAWMAAMQTIAARRGLTLDPHAPVHIVGACVFAHRADGRFPQSEVTIEAVVESPGGKILFRRTEARPTLADAVGAALDFVVAFARRYGMPAGGAR